MKAKSQIIYEELCKESKHLGMDKCYYLAVMGMSRTLCLCLKLSQYNYLQDLDKLYKFIHENTKEVFEHKQIYRGYDNIKLIFDNFSNHEDEGIYYETQDIQEAAFKSGLYEFLETWYAFLRLIKNSLEKYAPDKMISFITLPVRYLDAYLLEYYFKSFDEEQLQDFVNNHKIIDNEIKRISSDIRQVINGDHEALYEKACMYSMIDILK